MFRFGFVGVVVLLAVWLVVWSIVGGGLGWISGCDWWLRFHVCGWLWLIVTSGLCGWVCGWIDTSCVQFSEMRLLRWFDGGCRFGFIWCGLCV